jgi:molybdate transport system substrate-binding protein
MMKSIALVLCCATAMIAASVTQSTAAGVRILSVGSAEIAVKTLIPEFTKSGENTVKFEWGTPNIIWNRIKAGEVFDVVILSEPAMQELMKEAGIKPDTHVRLARTGLGVVIPASAPMPDLSTPEAFKRSVLSAKTIAYRDPSLPNMSGEMVERVLKKIGIFDEVKPRMTVAPRPAAEDLVGQGKVELSFVNVSEIPTRKDIRYAGPVPAPLQLYTNLEAALMARGSGSPAAAAFLKFISSGPQAKSAWEQAGFETAATY